MKHPQITLAEVDAYEVPGFLAERISKIHEYPIEYAEGLIREAKRMLYLSTISEETAPSDRVDIAWHEMLMFTKFYRDFCAFLGQFVHHVPNPPPEKHFPPETWAQIQAKLGIPVRETPTYTKTKANYEKYFGEKPDPKYWP